MDNHRHIVIIIGGGIAGLATAYYLEAHAKYNQKQLTSILIERDDRWGGKILTETHEGFVIEAGPDAMLAQKPAGVNLCEQLGLAEELMGTNPLIRSTFVLTDGKLHKLPPGFTGFLPASPLDLMNATFLSFFGKLRMGMEPFIPPKKQTKKDETDDEPIADFLKRRFGNEAYVKFLEPFMSGIFAGDAEKLSMQSAFPRFVELEKRYGSLFLGLIKGRIGAKDKNASPGGRPSSAFITLQSGLSKLTDKLVESLRNVIFMPKTQAIKLSGTNKQETAGKYIVGLADGKEVYGDSVVLAVPAYEAANLIETLDPATAKKLNNIPYASTATVSLGYRKMDIMHPMDGTGFVVPKTEKSPLMAVTWTSCKWEHRSPEYATLLRCYLGRAGEDRVLSLNDKELVRLCQDELKKIMGIDVWPILERVYRWEKSMPQYLVGHADLVNVINERIESVAPGIYLTGSAYRGVGIPDCIANAEATATKVLSKL